MGTESYPKGGKPAALAASPLHSERIGSPYLSRAQLNDSAEDALARMSNRYGAGTSEKTGSESYPVDKVEKTGVPSNPRRTMISI